MDPNHSYGPRPRQFHVEIELLYECASLTGLKAKAKFQLGSRRKLKALARKFLQASSDCREFDGIFLQVAEPTMIGLPFQIVPDLPKKMGWLHRKRVQGCLSCIIS
jgi:hypothetical protein